jgi:hypothetical protein
MVLGKPWANEASQRSLGDNQSGFIDCHLALQEITADFFLLFSRRLIATGKLPQRSLLLPLNTSSQMGKDEG